MFVDVVVDLGVYLYVHNVDPRGLGEGYGRCYVCGESTFDTTGRHFVCQYTFVHDRGELRFGRYNKI